jgi:adenine-specific DNA-methyltransferase
MTNPKKTGSYYTPSILSDFLIEHIFNEYIKADKIDILEPSCGDGQFLQSLFGRGVLKDKKTEIELIDINRKELAKAVDICRANKRKEVKVNPINKDFLEHQIANPHKYSLIIGNPPYIKKNYLTKKQIGICREIHKKAGLLVDEIKNIWPAFLLSSMDSLDQNGVLCFVLPAELLQVKYTKPLRNKILSSFEKIEIFAFNELIFPDIEQDVIVLIGAKKVKDSEKGISFYQVEKLEDLKEPLYAKKHSNVHRATLDKWTNYILSDEELMFIDSHKQNWKKIKDYCKQAEVGIVTAANSFFIVNNDIIEKYNLKEYAKPILSRGGNVKRKIIFKKSDLNKCYKENMAVNLIAFENIKQCALKKNAKAYIEKGREENLHKRYKFKHRTHWHHIPLVSPSEGFFTKRCHLFPRIIANEAKVYVTDSFYIINMKDGNKIKNLAFSFYNTLTFILCELEGRYYGGGVLELTPNEFKNISIPYIDVPNEQVEHLNNMFKSDMSFDEILKYTDKIILQKFLKISEENIQRLRTIHKKLVDRRLKQLK